MRLGWWPRGSGRRTGSRRQRPLRIPRSRLLGHSRTRLPAFDQRTYPPSYFRSSLGRLRAISRRDRCSNGPQKRERMLRIELDDLSRPQVLALLEEHLRNMYELSPADQVFAFDANKLRA